MEQPKEYYAFISYKREDKKEAKRLQHALEYYRLPNHLRQDNPELPEFVRPIFRDLTDLEVGELSAQIHTGLEQSHFLIVVCSPRAAVSKWVNDEVEYFISLGKQDKIIPYIIEGVPHASNPDEECYPSALLKLSKEKELLGANINEVGKDSAMIRVVSRMFNIRYDTLYQRYQREQKKRRLQLTVVIVLAFLFLLGIAGWIWHQNSELKNSMSRAAANAAMELLKEGDSYLARKVAVLALDMSYTTEAEEVLRMASLHSSAFLVGHKKNIGFSSFSPDGVYIVSSSGDNTIRIWEVFSGNCKKILHGHTARVASVFYDKKGEQIVSASIDGTVRIWDAQKGLCTQVIQVDTDGVNYAVFSPDGNYIATASHGSQIRIWNTKTRQWQHSLTGRWGSVFSVNFSPDSRLLVAASADERVRVWNIETEECVQDFVGYGSFFSPVFFSSKGDQVLFVEEGASIWDIATGECMKRFSGAGVQYAEYTPSGNHIVTLSNNGIIRLWNIDNEELIYDHKVENIDWGETFVTVSPDEKYLLSAKDDYSLVLIEVDEAQFKSSLKWKSRYTNYPPYELFQSVFFKNKKDAVVISSYDKNVYFWDVESQRCIKEFEWNESVSKSVLSFDGTKMVSYSDDSIYIWDVRTGRCLKQLGGLPDTDYFEFVRIGPDNSHLISGSREGDLRIWDVETGECLHNLVGHSDLITYAEFSPDGKLAVSISNDQTIRIWDVVSGRCQHIIKDNDLIMLFDIAKISLDGKYIVSTGGTGGSSYGNVQIWNVHTGKCISKYDGHTNSINDVVFSPKGNVFASVSDDRTICIWELATGKLLHRLTGHTRAVRCASFSPNGQYIVSAAWDNSIRVWNVALGKCVQTLTGHTDIIDFVEFSPDGKLIISSSYDGTVKVWDFPPLKELIDETRERFKDNPLTPEERRQYYLE